MVTLADYHIFLVYSHIFVFSFLVHLEIYEDRQFFLCVQETRLYYLKVLIFHRNRHKVNMKIKTYDKPSGLQHCEAKRCFVS